MWILSSHTFHRTWLLCSLNNGRMRIKGWVICKDDTFITSTSTEDSWWNEGNNDDEEDDSKRKVAIDTSKNPR